jgi:hypothetical protein
MDASLLRQIEQLERSRRRWRTTALVLASLLLGTLLTSFGGYFVLLREGAMRAAEAERQAVEARRAMEQVAQKKAPAQ